MFGIAVPMLIGIVVGFVVVGGGIAFLARKGI